MSDEHDSWFKDAFGVDLGQAVQGIKDEASAVVDQVSSTVTQVVQGVQGAGEGALDKVAGAAAGIIKKVAGAVSPASAGGASGASGAGGGTGSFPLGGSVGRGGKNAPNDVRAVQAALGISADGQCGGQTIGAIEAFQRNHGLPRADGRVDPGGATERAMSGGAGASPAPASNQLSAAHDVAGASSAGRPPIAEDNIPRVEGETVFDQEEVEGEPASDTPAGPATTATIAVRANGDGSFTITGSGFSRPDVAIRAVDDRFGEQWVNAQTKDGKLSKKTPAICVAEGPIHFSVFAGTHPLVGDMLSNIAHSQCEGPAERKKEEEDKPEQPEDEDKPEQPEDDAETFLAKLKTFHPAKVRYFVLDRKTNKMVVNGARHAGDEVISFRCAFVSPDTGEVFYWRDNDESGGGETPRTRTFVSPGKVTDMLL